MRFFQIFLPALLIAFAIQAHAENCAIHIPVKDSDLTGTPSKYASIINGYRLVPHTDATAPFNLLLTDVSKGDSKNVYTVELTHASGFKKEYQFTMTEQDWNGHVLKDLGNLVIEKKMSEAKTVSEFQALKSKLMPEKNKIVPPMSELEFILKKIPSCENMFKK